MMVWVEQPAYATPAKAKDTARIANSFFMMISLDFRRSEDLE
jgi:hypothetical protein